MGLWRFDEITLLFEDLWFWGCSKKKAFVEHYQSQSHIKRECKYHIIGCQTYGTFLIKKYQL